MFDLTSFFEGWTIGMAGFVFGTLASAWSRR